MCKCDYLRSFIAHGSRILSHEAMSYRTAFNHILDRMYQRRTAGLRNVIARHHSRLRPLTKSKREAKIRDLQEIASQALAKSLAKEAFAETLRRKKIWQIQGRGRDGKLQNFRSWLKKQPSARRGKVYVFRNGSKCYYVGRTLGRGSRVSSHFRKSWFSCANKIDVYFFKSKK